MSFSLISKYRTELMGFAALWVLLFHFGEFNIPIIDDLISVGYGGVDIFIFLSGIGMAYSYKGRKKEFYIKRLLRIIPIYAIIIVLSSILLNNFNVKQIILDISCIGYYLPFTHIGYFEWYVPTILLFYFIFPFWADRYKEKPFVFTILPIIVPLILTIALAIIGKNIMLYLTVTRIPIFFIGAITGYNLLSKRGKTINNYAIVSSSIVTLIILIILVKLFDWNMLWHYGLLWIPFILITPGLCIAIAFIFDLLPVIITKIFFFIGKLSFEIYLVHIVLLKYFQTNDVIQQYIENKFLHFIILLFTTIVISTIINKLYSPIHDYILKKSI